MIYLSLISNLKHFFIIETAHGDIKNRECVTCILNIDHKDQCNWVNPSFSTNGKFVVINCGGTINGTFKLNLFYFVFNSLNTLKLIKVNFHFDQ